MDPSLLLDLFLHARYDLLKCACFNMLLIAIISLALVSFLFSAFVVLRIVIPVLPPHPLSRRVSPSEFGLPNFRSLSPADKSHIWLASLDIVALVLFAWQALSEFNGGSAGYAIASDPAAAARVWLALTLRQTCLLVVSALTLLHVRQGQSVTFGTKHWMLWSPMAVLVVTSTVIATIMAGTGVTSFFIGLAAYSTTIAVVSSVCFMCLIGTLLAIKRNLAVLNEAADPWPPAQAQSDLPRPSFTTEEIDVLKDGASWITSHAGSRRNSVSGWSFSTHATHTQVAGQGAASPGATTGSAQVQSSYWFNASATAPPVPRVPSEYYATHASPSAASLQESDPFRRHSPDNSVLDLPAGATSQRPRFGSQTSWMTSSAGSHTTVTAWSFPGTQHDNGSFLDPREPSSRAGLLAPPRPSTPALANANVLGGYGYNPSAQEGSEKTLALAQLAASPNADIDISVWRLVGWLVMIWVPMGLAFPFLFTSAVSQQSASNIAQIMLAVSLATSSPILAFNILLRSPLPIPIGLFDIRPGTPSTLVGGSSGSTLPTHFSHEYKKSDGTAVSVGKRFSNKHKRSTSTTVTVVDGRRSGDVWLTNGNAKESKSKFDRAFTMLERVPKLSVLPIEDDDEDAITPPTAIQDPSASMSMVHKHLTPSPGSAEMGRLRSDSPLSSGPFEESLAFSTRIMVAQRHGSALAQTMVIPASPPAQVTATSTAFNQKRVSHLRSRSHSSVVTAKSQALSNHSDTTSSPSPPPTCPLPPTPPNVRAARLRQLKHKKSFSSGYSLHVVEKEQNQIDELTAAVLPGLVPGLKIGANMRVTKGSYTPPSTRPVDILKEFGINGDGEFSSPEAQSTPYTVGHGNARRKQKKMSEAQRRKHMSLPSLGLGKDGIGRWSAEITTALDNNVVKTPYKEVEAARRNTIWGGETVNEVLILPTSTLARAVSTRQLGIQPDVPHGVFGNGISPIHAAIASSSGSTLHLPPKYSTRSSNFVPPSAASTATLFDLDFAVANLSKDLLEDGPLAESTPHNSVAQKGSRNAAKKASKAQPKMREPKGARRSSIVYIKSPDAENVSPTSFVDASSSQSSGGLAARLLPKAGGHLNKIRAKLQQSPKDENNGYVAANPSANGLRPLSLLQDRDTNSDRSNGSIVMPLKIGKKKSRSRFNGENAEPSQSTSMSSFGSIRGLKPLRLIRMETRQPADNMV